MYRALVAGRRRLGVGATGRVRKGSREGAEGGGKVLRGEAGTKDAGEDKEVEEGLLGWSLEVRCSSSFGGVGEQGSLATMGEPSMAWMIWGYGQRGTGLVAGAPHAPMDDLG